MKEKKLNVLVLTTSFPTKEIPVGMHVYNKCKYLVKKGISTTVLAPHYPGEKFYGFSEGIEIIRFPYFFPFRLQEVAYNFGLIQNIKKSILAKIQLPFFSIMFLVYGLIYGKKRNIIHAHWFPAGLIGVLIKKIFGNKLVLMMHHPHKPNFLYKYILKNIDVLFANSSYVLNKTNKIYKVKNSKVLPVPIDYNVFHPQTDTSNIRKTLDVPINSIFVFTVGRFIPWKGFEYLIEALKMVVYDYGKSDIFLRIAGQGPLKEKYINLIRNLKLQDYVKLIGYIPNTKIHKYYNEADIFVIPSIIDENEETEGFGVVSLEANACKTPVIGTKVGGIVDVIENWYNGFLVEQKNPNQIAEKIIKLAEDKELREEVGKNGRKKVIKEFNWDKIANEIIKIYKTIK